MRMHIMLIDDDNDELDILCRALNEAGIDHKCTWARGVTHALSIMEYIKPDLIFIDHNMPAINGMEGIFLIKKIERLRMIPLVLYSHSIPPEKNKEAIRLGAAACIEKPSTINGLCKRMQDFFETLPIHSQASGI